MIMGDGRYVTNPLEYSEELLKHRPSRTAWNLRGEQHHRHKTKNKKAEYTSSFKLYKESDFTKVKMIDKTTTKTMTRTRTKTDSSRKELLKWLGPITSSSSNLGL